jgi:hypothetical protein
VKSRITRRSTKVAIHREVRNESACMYVCLEAKQELLVKKMQVGRSFFGK